MQRPLRLRLTAPRSSPTRSRALAELGAASLSQARSEAERELQRAPRCGCCVGVRVHLARHVGSTLFLDDDPHQLQLALPPDERARFSPRLIAACIVLHGRARVDLQQRS